MRLRSLLRRVPPIARRDAQLAQLKRENRRLQRRVSRLSEATRPSSRPDATEGIEAARASGLFDDDWYREQVPGVANPLEHYLSEGHRDGRSPHPCFAVEWYLQEVGSQIPLDEAPLLHYLRAGATALISPHPTFLPREYAQAHPASRRHPGGPLGHFLSGSSAPLAAVSALRGLTRPDAFIDAAREASRALLATRSTEHLPRESESFDDVAERAWKSEMHAAALPVEPLVSVIVPTKDRADQLPAAVESVLAQTYQRWELIVVDDGSTDDTLAVLTPYLADSRVRVISHETNRGVAAACNTGISAATGTYIGYLGSDNTWETDFLELMIRFMVRDGHRVAYAMSALEERGGRNRRRYRGMPYSSMALRERNYIDHIVVLHERKLLEETGPYDEGLRRNVDWDLLVRLSEVADFGFAPFIATRYDLWESGTGRITTYEPASYRYLIRQRGLVDWEAARTAWRDPDLTSVVLVVNQDDRAAARTVRRTLAAAQGRVEVVVVDSRLDEGGAIRLHLALRSHPQVRIVRLTQELPMEVARNVGACATGGGVLAFLPEAAWPDEAWDAPLVTALGAHGAVQPLVLRRDGTVWSAGAMRTRDGAAALLFPGHPGDASELRQTRAVPGVTPLVMAVAAADFLAVEGFDPLFVQDHVGPELSVRLSRATGRPSGVVGTSSVALTAEDLPATRGSRWAPPADNESRLADRWRSAAEPDLAGFTVAGLVRGPQEHLRPMLIDERPQRPLRWAIKIGAPDVPRRNRWGDWHFALALRDSLERLGHQVSVDCREAWYRETAHLDDVTLVLRGRGRYRPNPDHLNLAWVISHPDEVTLAELLPFDRVFGASPRWCERISPRLPHPAQPLLQCTDHRRFAPGPPDPERAHEVLVVANARGVRPAVAAAIDGGVAPAVYGFGWKGMLPKGAWHGDNVPNAELPAVYRSAGVVLNDHWEDMRREGLLSNRLFDLAACEARVISDHLPEIDAVFGDVLPTYGNPAELPALIRDVLADSPERQRARRELGERVRSEHTFDVRARELSAQVTRLQQQRGGR